MPPSSSSNQHKGEWHAYLEEQEYGLAALQTVKAARRQRYMSAAMARNKTGQAQASAADAEVSPSPATCTTPEPMPRPDNHRQQALGGSCTRSRAGSRPCTTPVEPQLSDTLRRCLSLKCAPPAPSLPWSHSRTSSRIMSAQPGSHTTSQVISKPPGSCTSSYGKFLLTNGRTTSRAVSAQPGSRRPLPCIAHACGLPQWGVHACTQAQLLDCSTVQALPLATTQPAQQLSSSATATGHGSRDWGSHCPAGTLATQQQGLGHSVSCSADSRHVVHTALAAPPAVIDCQAEDHQAWVYCCIEQARESEALAAPHRGLPQLPPQLMRFLLAEGRCLSMLDLSNNQLLSSPPWELLPALQHVNLAHNRLESLGATLCTLSQLQELHVSHNRLAGLPSNLGRLASLQLLDISHNCLDVLPASTTQLSALRRLEVGHNQLQCLPAGLGALLQLEHLDAMHNQLTALPHTVGNCKQLTSLQLDHNLLSALPVSIGGLHSSLCQLQLHGNQLSVLPREVALLTSLTHLSLDDNPLHVPPRNVTCGGVVAVRMYLSSYVPCRGITLKGHHSSPHQQGDRSCNTSSPAAVDDDGTDGCSTDEAMDEAGEQLLHLQLERDELVQQNLELKTALQADRARLALVEEETTDLLLQQQQQQLQGSDQEGGQGPVMTTTQGKDAVALGRMVHHLQLELRRAQAQVADATSRAAQAEEQAGEERARRVRTEGEACAVRPSVQELQQLRQALAGSQAQCARLEELVASHLFQQRASEDRCLEAEARLEMLELGTLSAWRHEVQHMRHALQQAWDGKRAVEAAAAARQQDLLATLSLLERQLDTLHQERDTLAAADAMVAQVHCKSGVLGHVS